MSRAGRLQSSSSRQSGSILLAMHCACMQSVGNTIWNLQLQSGIIRGYSMGHTASSDSGRLGEQRAGHNAQQRTAAMSTATLACLLVGLLHDRPYPMPPPAIGLGEKHHRQFPARVFLFFRSASFALRRRLRQDWAAAASTQQETSHRLYRRPPAT